MSSGNPSNFPGPGPCVGSVQIVTGSISGPPSNAIPRFDGSTNETAGTDSISTFHLKPTVGALFVITVNVGRVNLAFRNDLKESITVTPDKVMEFVKQIKNLLNDPKFKDECCLLEWEHRSHSAAITIVCENKDMFCLTQIRDTYSDLYADLNCAQLKVLAHELEVAAVRSDMENVIQNKISVLSKENPVKPPAQDKEEKPSLLKRAWLAIKKD